MIYLGLLYLSPLAALSFALFAHGRDWAGLRLPVYFSLGYLILQGFSFGFVWYCFSQGYQDWIVANLIPQGLAYLSLPASWVVFIMSFSQTSSEEDPQ